MNHLFPALLRLSHLWLGLSPEKGHVTVTPLGLRRDLELDLA